MEIVLIAAQAHTLKADRAVVISVRSFMRMLGGAVGLAICAAVLSNTLHSHLPTGLELDFSTYSIPDLSGLGEVQREKVMDAYMAASQAVFILQVPFMGACLLMTVLIKDKGLERNDDPDREEGEISGRDGGRDEEDVSGKKMAQ